MPFSEPTFTVGIEEEYLLVDPKTRALVSDPPEAMHKAFEARFKNLVKPEFLKSQIEVATRPCETLSEAGENLAELRRSVSELAGEYGLAPIAASTHPFSKWQEQKHTDKRRYNIMAEDMQTVVHRLLVCGMHVHVGVEDDEMRIDLLNQVAYFLPHLLALSTSSPFWRGHDTGLMSYRLSIFDELPRTGLPERFDSFADYKRHVRVLQRAGLIEDASMLWWDARLSARFPTLEMRITDVCTRLDDALGVAALFLCIVRMLYRLRRANQRWRMYANMLINENRWRAQRYGLDGSLMDFGAGELVPFADLIEELLDMVAEDSEALNCVSQLAHVRDIVKNGASAHRQLEVYKQTKADGKTHEEALDAVVDMLVEETIRGV